MGSRPDDYPIKGRELRQTGGFLPNILRLMLGNPSSGVTEREITERTIHNECNMLAAKKTRGDLGMAIATIVLTYSPRDLQQMKWNFSEKIRDINPEYRKRLEETKSPGTCTAHTRT